MTETEFLDLDDVVPNVAEGYIPIKDEDKRIVGWKKNYYSTTAGSAADGGSTSTLEDLVNAPAGNYTLQVTDNKGCTGSFAFILSDIVSSTSPETNFFAEISPNPAVDKATLFISLSSPQWLHVSVISADGRIVSTQAFDQVTEKNIPLPVKDLTAGVYTVRLFSENSVKSLQLVIGR